AEKAYEAANLACLHDVGNVLAHAQLLDRALSALREAMQPRLPLRSVVVVDELLGKARLTASHAPGAPELAVAHAETCARSAFAYFLNYLPPGPLETFTHRFAGDGQGRMVALPLALLGGPPFGTAVFVTERAELVE